MSAEAVRTAKLMGLVDLPMETASVPRARRQVGALLRAAGHMDADDAELLVGELVANAVKHADSRRSSGVLTVAVFRRRGAFRVEVADGGSTISAPRVPAELDADSEGGRGLWLVRELAASWGWYENVAGRVVWFEVTGR
ncbi:ATP-binding protein [Sphaerisporangium dianthi]|uniref:ATP-binding protein n=1 Tax=Sphaerisporangium dianthi TaxID=1436120 RepID=A0ABV9CEN4_9ACTN